MRKQKNGFTMIELLAVITIIGILSSIAVGGVSQYLRKARKEDFAILEKNMKTAVDNYFIDHSSSVPAIGGNIRVNAKTLTNEGYLTGLEDPNKTGASCNLEQSYVLVTRLGNANDFNMTLDYKVCVLCSKMKSSGC